MTDHQSLARDLLSIYERLTYLPTYNHADLATELRAALDRETALRAEVDRLHNKIDWSVSPPTFVPSRDIETYDESGFSAT